MIVIFPKSHSWGVVCYEKCVSLHWAVYIIQCISMILLCKESIFKMHEKYFWLWESLNSKILEKNLERDWIVDKQGKILWTDE